MNILNQELYFQPNEETSELELFINCVRLSQEFKQEYQLSKEETKRNAEKLFNFFNEKVYQEYGVKIFEDDPYLESDNGTTFNMLAGNYWFVFN
ncbi:hypothetical protein HMPREF2767_02980 [Nosocomiicoccus sp. HMSC067E10]|uniref:hypothetical protein n=1 Tax=Nosocomiicoccus sp. HMSC067E10 TaxID=1739271 RepID=UPI0008A19003|nr:hypothetical protein [Nosocomiicoccus sp. HMSC067E10]OFL47386.1 hypothetical protein HMPREF2767_02980 [Nosocomiicoccus sp. HMSC067E10]